MKITEKKISELKPSEYNPRIITEKQFKDLQKSLKKLDVLEPAVVNINPDRLNIIISGHQRIRAASALGLKTYPCLEVDFDIDKEREANIRMNKNGGQWDFDALANNFDPDDLKYFGFEDRELGFSDFGGGEETGEGEGDETKTKEKTVCPKCGHEF